MIHKRIFSAVSDLLSGGSNGPAMNGFPPGIVGGNGRRHVDQPWQTSGMPTFPGVGPAVSTALSIPSMPSQVGNLACSFMPEGKARDICMSAIGSTNGNGGAGTATNGTVTTAGPCPDGYYKIAGTDTCINPLAAPPGGKPLTVGAGGVAVVGSFGMPGISPSVVGNITKNDGTTGPILRCPSGMALANDNVCYVRSLIPKQFRKWNPGMKPLLTGGERKVLTRANTLRGKVKTLATASGFSCKKKC